MTFQAFSIRVTQELLLSKKDLLKIFFSRELKDKMRDSKQKIAGLSIEAKLSNTSCHIGRKSLRP